MTTLSLARDPRKLVNHHEGRTLYYRIIARNPRNPLPEPVPEGDNLKMKERIYSIRDWDEHYENSRSRRVESLRWVPVPNKHDGEGYGLVMEQDDAAELFAAWVLILQVASKCSTRGTLAREDGTAMSARTLAAKTRAPEAWFSRALEFFSVNVLWLEKFDFNPSNRSGRNTRRSEGRETLRSLGSRSTRRSLLSSPPLNGNASPRTGSRIRDSSSRTPRPTSTSGDGWTNQQQPDAVTPNLHSDHDHKNLPILRESVRTR
jgi:hypothetical protein